MWACFDANMGYILGEAVTILLPHYLTEIPDLDGIFSWWQRICRLQALSHTALLE
jgi:hypothetical protein